MARCWSRGPGAHPAPSSLRILAGWDGTLTVLLRKRVSRHIESCEICGERRRRELSPAMLFSILPLVALPAGLRHQVLRLVSDVSPDAARYRALVAGRAGPFGAAGFPVQLARLAPGGGCGRVRTRVSTRQQPQCSWSPPGRVLPPSGWDTITMPLTAAVRPPR